MKKIYEIWTSGDEVTGFWFGVALGVPCVLVALLLVIL